MWWSFSSFGWCCTLPLCFLAVLLWVAPSLLLGGASKVVVSPPHFGRCRISNLLRSGGVQLYILAFWGAVCHPLFIRVMLLSLLLLSGGANCLSNNNILLETTDSVWVRPHLSIPRSGRAFRQEILVVSRSSFQTLHNASSQKDHFRSHAHEDAFQPSLLHVGRGLCRLCLPIEHHLGERREATLTGSSLAFRICCAPIKTPWLATIEHCEVPDQRLPNICHHDTSSTSVRDI